MKNKFIKSFLVAALFAQSGVSFGLQGSDWSLNCNKTKNAKICHCVGNCHWFKGACESENNQANGWEYHDNAGGAFCFQKQ